MKKQTLGNFVRSAMAIALLAGSQFASADVLVGDTIKLTSSTGLNGGGAFSGSVVAGNGSGTFKSFCLEFKEHFSYNQSLYVEDIAKQTANAAGGSYGASAFDPISAETAYLFTKYTQGTLGGTAAADTALQLAIWFFEGEVSVGAPGPDALANTYISLATTAVSSNQWSGVGNVRALNLFTGRSGTAGNFVYSGNAQDQLYMISAVPEVETYAMMLAGLGLMGTIARRRKYKNA